MTISSAENGLRWAMVGILLCLLGASPTAAAARPPQSAIAKGRALFQTNCAICHGGDAHGGERGPSLISRRFFRRRILQAIRHGMPGGMPPFHFPAKDEVAIVAFVFSLNGPAAASEIKGDKAAGKAYFWGKGQCGSCHMIYGRGGVKGPDLTAVAHMRSVAKLEEALTKPGRTKGYQVVSVELKDGRSLRGFARNESGYDLQLQDFEGHFHFLEQSQIAHIVREKKPLMPAVHLSKTDLDNLLAYLISPSAPEGVPATTLGSVKPGPGDWPTYDGRLGGNRYSSLDQINLKNVSRLAPRWTFDIPRSGQLETTPVVVGGLMFVTSPNEIYALDASTGREVWHYHRFVARGKGGEVSYNNRGVAVLGNKVFMATPDAHLIALNRVTGGLVWDTTMADYRKAYRVSAAPLVVGNLVISGTADSDDCARGFVAAYNASTGKQVWRFWAMPAPGDPLASTWVGCALKDGGAPTWTTGTYDPVADLLYWTTGNPCPEYNGDERKGDNLYSDSVVALKPETGKLQWYFQFTPHDQYDWDANETPLVVDAKFHGRERHLLLQANRNGFFYVFDRITGKLLMATPFVHKLTWASGIAPDGRPKMLPNSVPTAKGTKICPSAEGGTNWMSPGWSPATGLFYVQALEDCAIYSKGEPVRKPGKPFISGTARGIHSEPPKKYLRAIDIQTGKIVWQVPQAGPGNTWGGALATAGGLVFFCDDGGDFAAVDAHTGKPLWHFGASQSWHASPMTYEANGRQYVAVAAGSGVVAFGLLPQ